MVYNQMISVKVKRKFQTFPHRFYVDQDIEHQVGTLEPQ